MAQEERLVIGVGCVMPFFGLELLTWSAILPP
jgi:hypothetical protein